MHHPGIFRAVKISGIQKISQDLDTGYLSDALQIPVWNNFSPNSLIQSVVLF